MPIVTDKLLAKPLLHEHLITNVTSDPGSGKNGQLILNTTDHKIKVYYTNTWQDLHTLTSVTPLIGNPMGLLLTLTYAEDQ